ncbi:hypothetical protein [Sphingomonas faeni]|uniref:hypothetical protein n=1 Tax=Sphingomonas faeni TaxID=185950 RepID=UPI0033473C59
MSKIAAAIIVAADMRRQTRNLGQRWPDTARSGWNVAIATKQATIGHRTQNANGLPSALIRTPPSLVASRAGLEAGSEPPAS